MSSGEYSVLFVCTANRIRSVMAEAWFRERLSHSDSTDNWRIGSAGTWAVSGLPPMPLAMQAMEKQGIDISRHASVSVDKLTLDEYNLILVMERGHQESLQWEFPEIADRVHLMSEMADGAFEITDPVSGNLQDHLHTADTLERIVDVGFDKICELASQVDQHERD